MSWILKKSPSKTLVALAFLAVAGSGMACGPTDASGPEAPPKETKVSVTTRLVTAQEIEDVARLPADLLPRRRALLAAEVPGTVEKLYVEAGERVRSGQILARIDTRSLKQGLAEAEAVQRRAEARFKRANRLFERRSITQQQLLDAVTDRDVAAARLASARLQLAKSTVRAPWNGEVAHRLVEVGDYVAPGKAIIEILDVSRLKVRAAATAQDVPFLKVGSPVFLHLDILEESPFEGELVRLATELDPSTRTLEVEAEIPNEDGRLKPGLYGRLEVVRRTIPQAVTVPLEALVDLGGEEAVFVIRQGRAHRQVVELGTVVGAQVVVRRGLEAGDRVVIEGQQDLGQDQEVVETTVPEVEAPTP